MDAAREQRREMERKRRGELIAATAAGLALALLVFTLYVYWTPTDHRPVGILQSAYQVLLAVWTALAQWLMEVVVWIRR